MLYKKNSEEVLSDGLFKNPTSEYRGAPFWAWNTKLNDEMLLKQIEIFKEMGIGGFHMHVRTGMETEYLSEEFMHFIKLCNEKAKKEDMLCWLYDEDRWPSGAAGGIVTKDYKLRARNIVLSPVKPLSIAKDYADFCRIADETGKCNGYFIARYGVKLDSDGFLEDYKMLSEDEEYPQGEIWYAHMRIAGNSGWYNGQNYIDTMNKKAVEKFAEVTYEAYYKNVGEDFGGSIPAIFTDEPQVSRIVYKANSADGKETELPFTDDFEETYKEEYGESILAKFPELIWEKRNNGCALTRYRYHNHRTERFVSAFTDTLGKWCEAHGIAFTGHMMEEPTLESQVHSLGEAMRCYRNFQIPGMDLLADSVEFSTAKQVQSAVHQYGREAMLSETYGITGWDLDFRSHKRQSDWQAAMGVTVRVHHLTWASMNGDAKRDYPASIGYQSPWYKQYSYVENHFARLYTALTRGTPDVRVGVIHPVESYWLFCGPNDKTGIKRNQLNSRFLTLTDSLAYSGIDFDFISESLLPEQCAEVGNPIKIGKMEYDCVVVPEMTTMRRTTLDKLASFARKGGKVILMGNAPEFIDGALSDEAKNEAKNWTVIRDDDAELIDNLEPCRFVNFKNTDTGMRNELVHQLRNDGEYKWLFFCHGKDMQNSPHWVGSESFERTEVTLKGNWDVTEYNTLTGEIFTPSYEVKNGKTVLKYTLFGEDSVLLRLKKSDDTEKKVMRNGSMKPVPLKCKDIGDERAEVRISAVKLNDGVKYTLDEPNVILLDLAEYAFDGEEYRPQVDSIRIGELGRERFYSEHQMQTDVQPWVPVPEELKNDKGHTVKRRFTFETEIELKDTCLALEMSDVARIFINGKEIEKEFDGWYVDECIKKVKLPVIPKGKVTVEIITPFTLRGRTEWLYVLGDFGVRVEGKRVIACKRKEFLDYGNAVNQTLPFYTGNITYHTSFEEKEGKMRTLQIPFIGGALARVSVDGKDMGTVAISPYCIDLGFVEKGEHRVDITLFGTRYNGFGPLHNMHKRVPGYTYMFGSPYSWRTYDSSLWDDSYHFVESGILACPTVY